MKKIPEAESKAQKITRIANEEKAILEEKRSSEIIERDSRRRNRSETITSNLSKDKNSSIEMATNEEVILLKEKLA